jgi:hypothetical protein
MGHRRQQHKAGNALRIIRLYTREAIEERRHLRSLMRQSRMLIKDIE